MGTCMGPSYACFFVGYVEQSLFRSYTATIPHLFLRYIIDCIGAALCSHEELEQFINLTNTFHPNLKFTWTISDTSISFLDLSVSISGPKKTFHIRQMFTCTSTNVVYCIRCFQCGILYIVMNHFNSPSHSLDDMSILGLLQCHNDATRKLEEQHLIFRL
eukprot:g23842.t1